MTKENNNNSGNNNRVPSFENVHWADNSAMRVLAEFPNEEVYTVASGISPSGIVHVGHFREVITTELVRRSLTTKGKKTNFIYSWDSYDAFRKVPKNVPEKWSEYLRLNIGNGVPDAFECHESWGEHFMQNAEDALAQFNFPIEFQRQHELQTSGIYADGIKKGLNNLNIVIEELNKFRDEDRQIKDDWMPLTVYCEKCGKDTTKVLNYDGEYTVEYSCDCGNQNTINFKETPIVKLPWRMDWPMRWNHYGVCFEPGGKDHSTPGGSFDTGCKITERVWNRPAPVYTFYNFIGMKGQGGKVSSSAGNGATIQDLLKVYTPEMVVYLFASTRPNAEFDISFDIDVIKAYEDFDKLERIYYGLENEKNPKKFATYKRIYELSQENYAPTQKEMPFQPSFRELTVVSQANDFEFEKVKEHFASELKTDFDLRRLETRFEAAKNWIEIYAPEDMKFTIQSTISKDDLEKLSENELSAVKQAREFLVSIDDGKELFGKFRDICENTELTVKDFFALMYQIILGKEKGPKLAGFMVENKQKVLIY